MRKYKVEFDNGNNFILIDGIKYEGLGIVLIDQYDGLDNKLTKLQEQKCRIRYARLYYLLKAIILYNQQTPAKNIPENWGWPSKELLIFLKTTLQSKKFIHCRSVDIDILESNPETQLPDIL